MVWTLMLGLLSVMTLQAQQSISNVRNLPMGSVVTTTGTITVGTDFGWLRYMQDADAGIALYSSQMESAVIGDSILVTGVLSRYRGELQISPVMSVTKVASGRPLSIPEFSSLDTINTAEWDSRCVWLRCMGVSSCREELESGWIPFYDAQGVESRMKVPNGIALLGYPLEASSFRIKGIWTIAEGRRYLQFLSIWEEGKAGCTVLPKGRVIDFGGQLSLLWDGIQGDAIQTEILYGVEGGYNRIEVPFVSQSLQVTLPFGMMEIGRLYQARLRQLLPDSSERLSPPHYFIVPSDQQRDIEVLFNRPVDPSFSDGSTPYAVGTSVIETDLIQRFDQVDSTLDIAMYNTNRDQLVSAVNRAVQRGVVVRYIADDETSNGALDGSELFPVQYRSGDGIMHHKFVIADVHDPEHAWVWTGSTNWSANQLSSDPNHAYIIHDQGMASNYLQEFNEMWGDGLSPGSSRTGDLKVDNSAHLLQLGDIRMESYFSPSDETACHIREALRSADHHVQIGLLLLTMDELTDEIIALHRSGIQVRVILEDEESSEDALARLVSEGVPVAIHDLSAIFHHKYAIIDEGFPESDPQVITGSHNWTWSADNINDENTLIIHDPSITNIFRQEFEARWKELVPTSLYDVSAAGLSIYPNPMHDHLQVRNEGHMDFQMRITDIAGREMHQSQIEAKAAHRISGIDHLASGLYFISFENRETIFTYRVVKE